MAKNSQLYQLANQQGEIFKRVRNGGLSIENALAGTQGILDGIYPTKKMSEYQQPAWYVGPESQSKRVQQLLDQVGCVVSIPEAPANFTPKTSTEVLMLAVYLSCDNLHVVAGVERTNKVWWDFIIPPKGYTKYRWEGFKSDPENLRLATNRPVVRRHRHGMRWVAFDPSANRGVSPRSCWNNSEVVTTLASAEILMAAALFPRWALSWNGESSPYPNMTGYQVFDGKGWNMTLRIITEPKLLKMTVGLANSSQESWSNPTVREL